MLEGEVQLSNPCYHFLTFLFLIKPVTTLPQLSMGFAESKECKMSGDPRNSLALNIALPSNRFFQLVVHSDNLVWRRGGAVLQREDGFYDAFNGDVYSYNVELTEDDFIRHFKEAFGRMIDRKLVYAQVGKRHRLTWVTLF